jgi:hypothetical protein
VKFFAHSVSIAAAVIVTLQGAVLCAAAPIALPARRGGYWEIRVVYGASAGASEMLLHACIDAATDKAMMEAGTSAMQSMCSRREMTRDGDAYVWDTECTMGPLKTTSHVVIAGDFQSKYTMTMPGAVSGLPATGGADKEPTKTVMTQNAKWLAADCPAGVKPGDMQMPAGITVNANDMIKSLGVAKTPWQP